MIIHSAIISACETGKQPDRAWEIFEEMEKRGLEPTTIIYSAFISACGKEAQGFKEIIKFNDSVCFASFILLALKILEQQHIALKSAVSLHWFWKGAGFGWCLTASLTTQPSAIVRKTRQ